MRAYSEERYADAREAVRGGLERMPDHAGLHYNYACFATRAGATGDDTFAHLRRSVELRPRFREDARRETTSPPYATTRDSRKPFAKHGPRPGPITITSARGWVGYPRASPALRARACVREEVVGLRDAGHATRLP